LIIYDQLDGFSLVYDNDMQVYPIESVFGIIEVKSKLSKEELIQSLENIKSVKSLCPNEYVTKTKNSFMDMTYLRPRPFGIVFAYSLSKNSLESLSKNLREWEKENSKEYWPNLVVVLNEGILYHHGEGMKNLFLFTNEELDKSIGISYLTYKKDTLFNFYSTLIDLCSGISLGTVNLKRYFDPAEQMGKYVVKNHNQISKHGEERLCRLSLEFIDKMVIHCKTEGKIKHRDLFVKQMGDIPPGMDNDYLDDEVYHYNPDGLPGIHEVKNPIDFSDGRAVTTQRMLQPSHWIEVDGEIYYFSWCYVENGSLEPIDGSSRRDL